VRSGWGGRAASSFRGLVVAPLVPALPTIAKAQTINTAWLGQIGTAFYRKDGARLNQSLSGVTRDSAGAPLGSCVTELRQAGGGMITQTVLSDLGGNYTFTNPGTGPFFIRAYKDGAPNLAGVTDRNLYPV